MWSLEIIVALGNNYGSSFESPISEEVRFGFLFAQNQIIFCMKTTKVFVKDVTSQLSS